MRTIVTKALITAALCCPLAIQAYAQDAQPEPQMGPTAPAVQKAECLGNPNPLGVARTV